MKKKPYQKPRILALDLHVVEDPLQREAAARAVLDWMTRVAEGATRSDDAGADAPPLR